MSGITGGLLPSPGYVRRETTSEQIARLERERDEWKVSLRDQLAMAAMTGYLSCSDKTGEVYKNMELISLCSYQQADAMLRAREQKEEK